MPFDSSLASPSLHTGSVSLSPGEVAGCTPYRIRSGMRGDSWLVRPCRTRGCCRLGSYKRDRISRPTEWYLKNCTLVLVAFFTLMSSRTNGEPSVVYVSSRPSLRLGLVIRHQDTQARSPQALTPTIKIHTSKSPPLHMEVGPVQGALSCSPYQELGAPSKDPPPSRQSGLRISRKTFPPPGSSN